MKNKIVLSLLVIIVLFVTGCGNGTNSSTFKVKDVLFTFNEDMEFHDFKYKKAKELEPDESKQAVYLEYVNKDIYDGRFVYRISLSFSNETTLKELLKEYKTESVKINEINWEKVSISNKLDSKDTSSIVYVTEKNSIVYVVTTTIFNETNVDVNELSNVFINGVTLK